jgi:hypothetical protein
MFKRSFRAVSRVSLWSRMFVLTFNFGGVCTGERRLYIRRDVTGVQILWIRPPHLESRGHRKPCILFISPIDFRAECSRVNICNGKSPSLSSKEGQRFDD